MDWPLTVVLGYPLSDDLHRARQLPETFYRITACGVVLGYRDAVWDDTGTYDPRHVAAMGYPGCPDCRAALQPPQQEQHQDDDKNDDQDGEQHDTPPVV